MKLKVTMLAMMVAAVASPAHADPTKGFYIGAGTGITHFISSDIKDDIKDQGDDIKFKGEGSPYIIYAGYQFNRGIGLELGYTDYAKTKAEINGQTVNNYDTSGASLSFNLGYSFDMGLRPFALIGAGYIKAPNDDNVFASHFGLGLDYTPSFLRHLTLRAAYQFDGYTFKRENQEDDDFAINGMAVFGAGVRF